MAWHHADGEDSRVGGGTIPVFRPQGVAPHSSPLSTSLFRACREDQRHRRGRQPNFKVPRSLHKGLSVLRLANFESFKHYGPPSYQHPKTQFHIYLMRRIILCATKYTASALRSTSTHNNFEYIELFPLIKSCGLYTISPIKNCDHMYQSVFHLSYVFVKVLLVFL